MDSYDMPAEWWQKAEDLFLAAAEMPEAEREEFLRAACREDARLRAEVASLLAHDGRNFRALESAIQETAASLAGEEAWIGRRLGAYRITAELGAGGMGAVYLAERADDRFEKKVAIKLVARAMGARLGEQLKGERRILAGLEHPYIAKLLDGGETDEGLPYIVMEYVQGATIDRYACDQGLDAKAICELLAKVCEAVAYAHRALVIHRDLKPSNILITADGTPKLLDFGIASLLAENSKEASGGPYRAFTREYASPEVIDGRPMTTAADVFSLGVILRQLLEGIETAEDVRAIVQMATRPEAEQRYQSADQLGEDLKGYLEGLPVRAREGTLAYRTGKFLRRNRMIVSAVALAFLGLSTTTGAALFQARRARGALTVAETQRRSAEEQTAMALQARQVADHEHQVATAERDRAVAETQLAEQRLKQLVDFASKSVNSIHSTLERIPGATQDRRKIVEETLKFLDRAREGAGDNPELLKTVMQGYVSMSMVLGVPARPNLGDTAAARANLKKAEELGALLTNRIPVDDTPKVSWMQTRRFQSFILYYDSQQAEAVNLIKETLEKMEIWRRQGPLGHGVEEEEAIDRAWMAHLISQDTPKESVRQANRSIQILERLVALSPKDDDLRQDLSVSYGYRMEAERQLADPGGALETGKRAVQIREELLRRHPDDVRLMHDLMIIYGKLGDLAGVAGTASYPEAREYDRKMIALAERIMAADPANQSARFDLAMAQQRAGQLEPPPGQQKESLDLLLQASTKLEQLAKESKIVRYERELALAWYYVGRRLNAQGDTPGAADYLLRSLSLAREIAETHPTDITAHRQVLQTYAALLPLGPLVWDCTRSVEFAQEAMSALSASPGRDWFVPQLIRARGEMYEALGQSAAACSDYRTSVQEWDSRKADPAYATYGKEAAAAHERLNHCRE